MVTIVQLRPFLYNKSNEIVVKLNDKASAEKMRKQARKKVTYKMNTYLSENNITTLKPWVAQTLSSGENAI